MSNLWNCFCWLSASGDILCRYLGVIFKQHKTKSGQTPANSHHRLFSCMSRQRNGCRDSQNCPRFWIPAITGTFSSWSRHSLFDILFWFFQAEAAFRPWWDNVEDNIVHSLVIIVRAAPQYTPPHSLSSPRAWWCCRPPSSSPRPWTAPTARPLSVRGTQRRTLVLHCSRVTI